MGTLGVVDAELRLRDNLTAGVQRAERAVQSFTREAAKVSSAAQHFDKATASAERTERTLRSLGVTSAQQASLTRDLARMNTFETERLANGWQSYDQVMLGVTRREERAASQRATAVEREAARKTSAFGAMGRALLAALAVERVMAYGQQLVATASHITDVAARTSMTIREVQRLDYVAKMSGTTLDTLARSAGSLADRLVEGKAGTVDAVNALGLSLAALQRSSPAGAMEAVADAVARIPDPMRQMQIATELFGESAPAIMAAAKAGIRSVGDEAERLGLVIHEQDVVALDALGKAWERVALRAKAAIAGMVGGLVGEIAGMMNMLAVAPGAAVRTMVRGMADAIEEIGRSLHGSSPELRAQVGMGMAAAGPFGQIVGDLVNLGNPLGAGLESLGRRLRDAVGPGAQQDFATIVREMGRLNTATVTATRAAAAHAPAVDRTTASLRAQGEAIAEQAVATEAYLRSLMPVIGVNQHLIDEQFKRTGIAGAITPDLGIGGGVLTQATNPYNMIGLQGAVRGNYAPQAVAAGQSMGAAMLAGMSVAFQSLPQVFTQAFTGGGGVMGAVKGLGVQLADALMRPMMARLQQMGRGTQGAVGLGAAGAGAIGGAFGGSTGALIGSTAAGIAGAALATTSITTIGAATTATGVAVGATTAGMIALGAATLGIGAAAVGIYLLAKKFFTVSKEVKQARADVQAFQEELWKTMTPMQVAESAGQGWAATLITVRDAYMRMGYSAAQAESVVDKLLDTSRPEAARDAMAQINDVVGRYRNTLALANEQMGDLLTQATEAGQRLPDSLLGMLTKLRDMGDLTQENIDLLDRLLKGPEVDWKKYEEAAGRYGIDPNALGQGFQQSKATATAQQMVDDVDLLLKGGATMGTILFGMREEISKLVQDSIQFGTTLPENMRPWIEELAKSGLLLDKNGEAITDLAGIKFADSLETSFQRIANSIQALVDLLNGPLQSAFGSIPKNVGVNVDVTTPTDSTHIYDRGTETTGFAGGTIAHGSWFRNFKGGTPTVLHGEEAVVRKDQVGAFVSAFGGDRSGTSGGRGGERPVVLKLRDNRILAEVVAAELDGLLARRGVRR